MPTIAIMPLWKLQTVGGQRLDFIYPNEGRGGKIRMRGEAVYTETRPSASPPLTI